MLTKRYIKEAMRSRKVTSPEVHLVDFRASYPRVVVTAIVPRGIALEMFLVAANRPSTQRGATRVQCANRGKEK